MDTTYTHKLCEKLDLVDMLPGVTDAWCVRPGVFLTASATVYRTGALIVDDSLVMLMLPGLDATMPMST